MKTVDGGHLEENAESNFRVEESTMSNWFGYICKKHRRWRSHPTTADTERSPV
jgi:hypothetical protein